MEKSKKEMNKKYKTNEGLGDMATAVERDHEVQMARAELYKIAKYAIKLHEMLKGVSEAEGLEGWVQSKITKSADYIGSVYHHLDYDQKFGESVNEAKGEATCGCGSDCDHCGGKHTMKEVGKTCECCGNKIKEKTDEYKESLKARLAEKLAEKKDSPGIEAMKKAGNAKADAEAKERSKKKK